MAKPEELLERIKREQIELVMLGIAMNNNYGYTYKKVDIDNFRFNNGRWHAHVPDSGWVEVDPVTDRDMSRINHHLHSVTAIVIGHNMHQNGQEVIFLYSYGDNQEDSMEKTRDSMFLDMINYFGIKTWGKITNLAKEADEIAKRKSSEYMDVIKMADRWLANM